MRLDPIEQAEIAETEEKEEQYKISREVEFEFKQIALAFDMKTDDESILKLITLNWGSA